MKDFGGVTRRSLLAGAAGAAVAGLSGGPALAAAPMTNRPAPAHHRFKLGAFEVTIVSDGPLNIGPPKDGLLTGVTADDMKRALERQFLAPDAVEMEQNALVVNTGKQLVLFDTGTGGLDTFGPNTGRLVRNLRAAGIRPADIDAVMLTHAHADHCFGLMTAKGARVFPKAQIYMSQADFDFWTDESKAGGNDMMKMMIGGARRNLLPNRDRIVFIKDGQEPVPGIQAMATPGHTVGHLCFTIVSEGKMLFNLGDVAHHHVLSTEMPRAAFAYDTDGNQGVATRLRVFDMLVSGRTPIVAYHFPWPGLGYIGRAPVGYRYVPAPLRTVL
ncbi:MAG: MBL fold metallo-hydrolase [Alphaproteobacteria bacterium]|nr:MBL fold metallo-hydrolase [Alphaproteobacteria bacterium]